MSSDITQLGLGVYDLPIGWIITRVGSVAEVNEKSIQSNYPHRSIEYIDISSVDLGIIGPIAVIPLKEAPSRARRIVRDNDSIISTVRPNLMHYAFIQQAAPNLVASTGFAVVSAKTVGPRFLYYYLTTSQFTSYLTRIAESHTSAYPAFNPDVIEDAELLLPPRPEQSAIAHILGTLDDKIELNRRMNETLEGIARANFKSWFVDFDPVRAKSEGWDTGLPKHIADLFPDRFVDSDLGKIPEGWGVIPVGDAVEAVGGATPSTKDPDYWEGGSICWATPKDLSGLDAPILMDTNRKITEKGLSTISSRLLPANTLLLSSRAPVGYLAIASMATAINQGFIAMICNGPVSNYFMLNWCHFYMAEIKQRASGTTFAEISKRAFRPIPIMVPSSEVMGAFDDIVTDFYEAIESNLSESNMLTSIRDTLLPKLVSGELRIKNAKEFLREVS